MKDISQKEVIAQLTATVESVIQTASYWQQQDEALLNWKENATSWSVLECLAHLNYYTAYYLEQAERQLDISTRKVSENTRYQSGWLGNYFCKTISPDNLKKTKTLKHLNPIGSSLNLDTLTTFLAHQERFIQLMDRAKQYDLVKTKIPLEFFKAIRLRLGDVCRFLVAHEQRHLLQAQRVIQRYEQEAVKSISG